MSYYLVYLQLDLKDKFRFYISKIFSEIIQQSKSKESSKEGLLCSPVNMAGSEGKILGTIIPDTTVQILNTAVKPI